MKTQKNLPPRWADKFLQWFCSEELLEEIQGDVYEAYHFRRSNLGRFKANWLFVKDVFQFFKPYSFEKHSKTKQFIPLFRNYFKIAARNVLKRKGLTALNVLGLTAGVSTVMLVSTYIYYELTYDQQQPGSNQVYRLVNNYRDQTYTCMKFADYYGSTAETQMRLVNKLNTYDQVEEACHFLPSHSPIGSQGKEYIQVGDKRFTVENILYTSTGEAFQSIFPQKFILGSTEYSFAEFDRVVLTEKLAKTYFGESWKDQELMGKSLDIAGKTYNLGGVVAEPPGNVHYSFDIIIHQDRMPSWAGYTYVRLNTSNTIDQLLSVLNQEIDLVYPGNSEDVLEKGVSAVALTDIHFTDDMLYELKPIANKAYLKTFAIVAIVVLLIIWTNYTNLSIAAFAVRQRELGVRKVMGAISKDISMQVLMEGLILSMLCFPIAWIVVYNILPFFNDLMEISIDQSVMMQPLFLICLLGLFLISGAVSSLYPAIVFGKKSLVKLFEAKLGGFTRYRHFNLRNTLLTAQFVMIVGLLSIAFYIQQQMDFVSNKSLGYEKEGVLYFGIRGKEKYDLVKQKLQQIPEVQMVGTGEVPGQEMYHQLTYKMKNANQTLGDGTQLYLSLDNIDVLGISCEACEGLRNGLDSVMVINRTAAKKLATTLGLTEEQLIGETLVMEPEWENEEFGFGIPYVIAGIVEDFDYFSLKYQSQSLLMEIKRDPEWAYIALVKANTNNWFQTISAIEAAYLEIEKEVPFEFEFLEDRLTKLYTKEKNAGMLAAALTAIAIILATIGLIGVTGFMTYSRQKEISIRKVFGASVSRVLYTLNKEFLLMVSIATIVALPIALFLANSWLQSFAFRINPSFTIVVLSGVVTALLIIMVVSIQSYKTARSNPSDMLNSEN